MIKQYIQVTQKKCNFCYEWFTVKRQVKDSLHICDPCLVKALNSTAFKASTSSSQELYQIVLLKNQGNFYEGINVCSEKQNTMEVLEGKNINEESDEYDKYNKQYLLDRIDQFRNKQMLASTQKWNNLLDYISSQPSINEQQRNTFEHIYELMLKDSKQAEKKVKQFTERGQWGNQKIQQNHEIAVQVKAFTNEIGTSTQTNENEKNLTCNSFIVNQSLNIPEQTVKATGRMSLPVSKYSRVIEQAREFLKHNNKITGDQNGQNQIKTETNTSRHSLNRPPKTCHRATIMEHVPPKKQQKNPNKVFLEKALKECDQNIPMVSYLKPITPKNTKLSTSTITPENNNDNRSTKEDKYSSKTSISPFQSLKHLDDQKTNRTYVTPSNKNLKLTHSKLSSAKSPSFSKSPARITNDTSRIQKQLAAIKNDKLKSKIYQYLLTNNPSMPASLLLLTTLSIYDTLTNTNTLNKCIELISYSINALGVHFLCYLEMLDWSGIEIVKIVKSSMTDEQFEILLNFIIERGLKIETIVVTANKLSQRSYDQLRDAKNAGKLKSAKNVYMARNKIKAAKLSGTINESKVDSFGRAFELFI